MVPFAYSPDMMISPAHVNDVGEGIALAAERGRPGETTILAGESMSLREVFAIWITQPGGLKSGFSFRRVALGRPPAPNHGLRRTAARATTRPVTGFSRAQRVSTSVRRSRSLPYVHLPSKYARIGLLIGYPL